MRGGAPNQNRPQSCQMSTHLVLTTAAQFVFHLEDRFGTCPCCLLLAWRGGWGSERCRLGVTSLAFFRRRPRASGRGCVLSITSPSSRNPLSLDGKTSRNKKPWKKRGDLYGPEKVVGFHPASMGLAALLKGECAAVSENIGRGAKSVKPKASLWEVTIGN